MQTQFDPPRRRGIIFQLVLSVVLAAAGGLAFLQASQAGSGPEFLITMVISLALLLPSPVLLYRTYSLVRGFYRLDRDQLQIKWGLRDEVIPLPDIEWICMASDLPYPLPLPLPNWPGSLRGKRHVPELGEVEFMASERQELLLIATPQVVFAISPADPQGFIRSFRKLSELGSLASHSGYSLQPSAALMEIWSSTVGRRILAAGLALELVLLIWVGLTIAANPSFAMGFTAAGRPTESGPSERLLLLPILNGVFDVVNIISGLYFYRRTGQALTTYILWGMTILTPALMLAAMFFMTRAALP
ncbi:MAG TPA: PH domain-containing protein [Anaerolineaceae bacterium]|nr:PH domain-containing protein [Anaerolineaceae bacterium]HPN52306.1 PH domain-containing protein [Anaerolineaceae bacterium]